MNRFKFKILNVSDALVFSRNNICKGNLFDMTTGKIFITDDLEYCKKIITKNYLNQSVTIYKLDNSKLGDLVQTKKNTFYTKMPISKNAIVEEKTIYFDVNNISDYLDKINKLEKQF